MRWEFVFNAFLSANALSNKAKTHTNTHIQKKFETLEGQITIAPTRSETNS